MLARYRVKCPDRLRADFQQFYGLDIDGMGTAYTLTHAAALAAQLPVESRCYKFDHPEAVWTTVEYMLAEIAYEIAVLVWQNSKDGAKGINRPKRPVTPAKHAELERMAAATDFDYIDKMMGGSDG